MIQWMVADGTVNDTVNDTVDDTVDGSGWYC